MILQSNTVYIAGPMTGYPMFNYPAFFGLAGLIEKVYHCRVLNPARHRDGLEYEEYMTLAMDDLAVADTVIMLRQWERSSGANREYGAAVRRGLRIFYQNDVERDLNHRLDNHQNGTKNETLQLQ